MDNKQQKMNTQPSVIRGLFEYAKRRKAEIGEDKVFDFSLGNPHAKTPKEVNDAIIILLKNTDPVELHGYTANSGLPEAKRAVKNQLKKEYDVDVDENLIYITLGASPAIVFTIQAFAKPDKEVVLFAPYFPEYTHYINHVNGKYVVVNPTSTFLPDLSDFEKKINERTSLVIINSPNNPSGVFYPEEVIKGICAILSDKEKQYGHPIYLLSDEPYRDLLYEGEKYPFIFRYYDDSLVAYSFSKSLSLAGERIGYLVVNPKASDREEVYAKVINIGHNLGYVSTTSLFQHLLPSVINLKVDISGYKENRDLLYKTLTDIGFEVIYPKGAFYMFVKAPDGDANRFSDIGKNFELIMVPSDSFGVPGYVRLAYCVDNKVIRNSKEAFKKLYECYGGKSHD